MTQPSPVRLFASLVIDYVRWTQLTPMLLVWGVALLVLLAMFVTTNEEAFWGYLEHTMLWIAGLPVIGDAFVTFMQNQATDDGRLELDGRGLEALALRVWGWLSLAFWLLSMPIHWLFGPFEPRTLGQKLRITLAACAVLVTGFGLVYLSNPALFNGPGWRWMFMFAGFGVLVFIVSAWCLSIVHVLGVLNDRTMGSE